VQLTEFIEDTAVVEAAHALVLDQWGGMPGTRDEGAIAAALYRPINKAQYGDPAPDLFSLGAAYAYGLVKAHGYLDGNKRTAWAVCAAFLRLNGYVVVADDMDKFRAVISLVTDAMTEEEFADWARKRAQPLP
jgi:death-on-curing protein